MNFDKSNFTFKWVEYKAGEKYPLGPADFKFKFQYKTEDGKLAEETRTWRRWFDEDTAWAASKKDLHFYQPYFSNEIKENIKAQKSQTAYDMSNYAELLNRLRRAYKQIQEGEPFTYINDRKKFYASDYKIDFKAKFGEAIIVVNIGNSHSEYFRENETIEINTISKLDEVLRKLKRRMPYLNQKYDEAEKDWRKISNFPTFKNGRELLRNKLESIYNQGAGNVSTVEKIMEFLESDEFKSLQES